MTYTLKNIYNQTRKEAYEGLNLFFEPLVQKPKTVILICSIYAAISLIYFDNNNNNNPELESQNNTGLEKIIENKNK